MGAFGGLILTNLGRNLQAKAQTGVQLNFTRIAVGDGYLGGSVIADLNALKSEKKSLSISKLKIQSGGKAVVGAVLSNQDMATGFYFREIGVFAQDPDVGEILYCYGNAGDTAEYIPAGGGSDIIEKSIDVVTIVGNAANVSAVLDSSLVFASAQDLQNHIDDNTNPHNVTPEQIGAAKDADLNAHTADAIAHIPYAVNTSGTDDYAITIPGITAYVPGMEVRFKATVANSSSATLNINNLGAKPIVRGTSTNLVTGDIPANKIVTVVYDGTCFQLMSQGADVSYPSKSETLTNKTLSAPKMSVGSYIADANGNELIKFPIAISSAVNEISISNAATGSGPSITASGNDANIDLNFTPKGTGVVRINGRAKVAAPSEADDIARKDTVDAVQANLNAKFDVSTGHGHSGAAGDGKRMGYQLLGSITLNADATVVSFTGLDSDVEGGYFLEGYYRCAQDGVLRLLFNGDTTASGYIGQKISGAGTTVSTNVSTDAVSLINRGDYAYITAEIGVSGSATAQYPFAIITSFANTGTDFLEIRGISRNVSGKITQIDIQSGATNGIYAGSRFRLFRRL